MHVLFVAPVGEPAYGVSPYANSLLSALHTITKGQEDFCITPLDFQNAYPKALYPSDLPARRRTSGLHWAKPATWEPPRKDFDIAHIQYWTPVIAPYLLAHLRRLKSLGIKVIITLHNVRSHEKIRLFDRCEKSLLNEADKVVSHFETTELRRRLRNRLVVIPHGIEIRSTGPPETIDYANTALNPRNRYCLSFGNIRPYKGTLDLLRAWNSIHSNFPQHGLLIAGRLWSGKGIIPRLSGKLLGLSKFRKEFEYLRSRALSQRVTFFDGYLQDDLIDSLCRISELAIFPYHHFQAQSGAATRAAGFGRRLLVSNAGALPQLVHDQKFTFEQGNFRELCDKLSSLLAAKPVEIERDEQRQKMLAKSCSWPAVARQHVSLYHSVLESE